jgi:hypothetical protein
MNVKRKRGFLARLLNPFAEVLSPIGLQTPSKHRVSRPAGGAFITPAIYYSYDFLLRWRAAAVVLHLFRSYASTPEVASGTNKKPDIDEQQLSGKD